MQVVRLAALTAALFAIGAVPAYAGNGFGPKVDDVVASALAAGNTVPVIVSGDIPAINRAHGLAGEARFASIQAESAEIDAATAAALVADSNVTAITADAPVVATGTTTPIDASRLATLHPLVDGALPAWRSGLVGAGVGIVVIDSGVRPLPDFGDRVVRVDLGDGLGTDSVGHGTFVAGLIAGSSADGRFLGLAPRATIYSIDVSNADGIRTSDLLRALDWVAAHRKALNLRVVNLSLSETIPSSYRTSPLDAAVEGLWRDRVVVVAAAGNLGPGAVAFAPANDPFVVTVGALDTADTACTGDDTQAAWSSTGPTPDGIAKPDILAPGRHVVSTLPADTLLAAEAPRSNDVAPGYAMANGTSFAAPQVTAAAALLASLHPEWSPDAIKGALVQSARAVPGAVGALDVGAAVAVANPRPANQGVRPAGGRTGVDAPADFNGSTTWTGSATWTGSVNWTASATWNASASWTASGTWTASATWNASGTWTASGTWN